MRTIESSKCAAVYFANLTGPILEEAGLDAHITNREVLVALLATMPDTAFEAIDIEIGDWYETATDRRHGTWSFTATLTPHGVGDVYRPRIRVCGKWRIVRHPCSLCPRVRETVDAVTIV